MTEIETLLLNSLKILSAESEAREKRLTEQLNAVSKRLDTMTSNYQTLQKQIVSLSQQAKTLSEELQK